MSFSLNLWEQWQSASSYTSVVLIECHSIENIPRAYNPHVSIGLYRENAIAIQNESGDSNGGNV